MLLRIYLKFFHVASKDVVEITPLIYYGIREERKFHRRHFSTFRTLLRADNDVEDFKHIRKAVQSLCAKFPGAYWQALEKNVQMNPHKIADP